MEKKLLHFKSKKGISEVVSYTLLIIISVALVLIVFSFLKVYIPKFQTPECPSEVNIAVQNVSCSASDQGSPGEVSLILVNKGFFTVDAVYVRFREPERTIKAIIDYFNETEIKPGETISIPTAVSADIIVGEGYTLEVQPSIYTDEGELAVCEKSVVKQKVSCN